MEPADLNSSAGDDRLECLLKQERSAPLADAGFSARVLAALPRENRRLAWMRAAVLAAAALAGFAVALAPGSSQWTGLALQIEHAIASVSNQLADPQTSLAVMITVAALVLVLNSDDSPTTRPD